MEHQTVQSQVTAGEILADKYRVERILGMGGMGVVVAATHLDLREERAIKLVRPELTQPHIIERFLREARAVVRLRSEHVATVYDTGRLESGAPFIVMELLHGEDLAAVLKQRGTLPVHEAVHHMMQACDALAEAHGRGIIHRDLKPANLFLTHREDGSPCIKVLDFGVSKVIPQEGEAPEGEMTNNGDIMGSPLYMAPEQMRAAREVDARADIWALGAILYKLLTGKAPFQRATAPEIFMAVLGSDVAPQPSSMRRCIPSGLDAVIMRCLAKDPDTRFSRVVDLKAALSPYAEARDGAFEEEALSAVDDPRSSRASNSSRPIPRNIDAILLGCIGQDPKRQAARSPRRRMNSDPFLKRVEPRDPPTPVTTPQSSAPPPEAPPEIEVKEASSPGGGTIPIVDSAALGLLRRSEEATALRPPLVPTFPPVPTDAELDAQAAEMRASRPSLPSLPAIGEASSNSMAPWDYATTAPPAKRRGKPLALFATATTALFIVVAIYMAFTTGGERATAKAASGGERVRPAAGGLEAPLPSASASVSPPPAPESVAEGTR